MAWSSACAYFTARDPDAHTNRTRSRFFSPRSTSSTSDSAQSTIGSRLEVWLHADRTALSVSGYVAGTVTIFSSKHPSTRCSRGSSTGRSMGVTLGTRPGKGQASARASTPIRSLTSSHGTSRASVSKGPRLMQIRLRTGLEVTRAERRAP